ncbi:RcnB family protein [Massilia sp. S19_KUP03_FR1]|uniref:RcnB family protein n=1 Tax=Massilia sp. S19_KUP03_FR1 TaxID=3025503 RepID=UPI002FCDB36B
MFKKLLIPVLIAATISSVAVAQDRGQDRGRDDRNRGDNMQRNNDNNRDNNHRGNDHRGNDRRDDHRNDYRGNDQRGPMAHNRGAGPRHDLRRGGRLPSEYRNRQYVVNDWRGHRLSSPPRGYQWVQTGSDYVLVAAATGLIASILLSQ